MKEMNIIPLKQRFEACCNEYIAIFCQKEDLELEFWVGDLVGSVAAFSNDDIFYFEDIAYDINTKQPKGLLRKWFWENIDAENKINYRYYCKTKAV